MKKITVKDIRDKKKQGEKIVALTAYDTPFARILDEAGVDIVLVGDSVGMVMLGYTSTLPVTMREMLHHLKAARRGVERASLVGDMPFSSFQASHEKALRNAVRFVKEGGADAVKIEGGREFVETVRKIDRAGIPVMGHLGLTPQSVEKLGGYKVQGKTEEEQKGIIEDAQALEKAGIFALVLECVPHPLAERITKVVSIPTIGIGAGPACDGQVLVLHDLLGIEKKIRPHFARRYAEVSRVAREAVAAYCSDVRSGRFPTLEESFG